MLANIFIKALRDRWVGTLIGMAIAGAFLVMAMAVYQDVDVSIYSELPEGVRAVMGIPADADSATLAYDIVLGLIAAMTLSGFAVSMGAASIAGEEREGTIGLLLANPRSRRRVLGAQGAAMAALVIGGALLTLGAAYLAPAVLGVDIGAADLVAVSVHLLFNAFVWGASALAVGAVTGDRSLALSVSAGVMVACYFLVGLLPLFDPVANMAKVLPWYWFDGHDPLDNGIAVGYLALQAATAIVLCAVAWWGVERRDLTKPSGSANMMSEFIDRLRNDERAAALLDRVSGGARVGSIWAKTTAEGQALMVIVGLVMFALMGLMMGPMYAALEGTLVDVSSDFPDNLLAMVGGGDMSTPEGWYQLETFGLMAPIAVALVAAAVGARALAGEEHDRTMGLLLANPVPRRRVVVEKFAAMVVQTTVIGVAIFAGVAGGSVLGGLGMSFADIAATSLLVTLLGIMFGSLALAISATTGKVRTATAGTIGVFGAAYAFNSILAVADGLSGWKRLSPFDWYLGDDPLHNGVDWTSVCLFLGFSALFVSAAVALFDRRDLRRG